MPYTNHVKVVARFNLGPGSSELENASCSLSFPDITVMNASEGQRVNAANHCYDAWSAFITNTAARFAYSVRLMEVRYYVIGPDGLAQHPPAISERTPVKGTGSERQHPYQVSNVVSLVASPGGKGRFGRIYLPPQSFDMNENGDGQIVPAHLTAMSGAAFAFLEDISDKPAIDGAWALRIAGQTGSGTLRTVEEVRFGKVPDTQRRRRRNLEEGYVVASFDA